MGFIHLSSRLSHEHHLLIYSSIFGMHHLLGPIYLSYLMLFTIYDVDVGVNVDFYSLIFAYS